MINKPFQTIEDTDGLLPIVHAWGDDIEVQEQLLSKNYVPFNITQEVRLIGYVEHIESATRVLTTKPKLETQNLIWFYRKD